MVHSIARPFTRRSRLAAFAAAAIYPIAITSAQDPTTRGTEQLLPASTLFTIFVDDLEASSATSNSSPMSKIMAESEVQAFLEKPKKAVAEMAQKLTERLKKEKGFEDFNLSMADLTAGTYGRFFVALTHVTLPGPDNPDPDIGFVIGVERRAGAPNWIQHAKALLARAAAHSGATDVAFESIESDGLKYDVLRGAGDGERPPVLLADVSGTQFFSTSKRSLLEILARYNGGQADSLATHPNWVNARKEVGAAAPGSVQFYLDFEAMVRLGRNAIGMASEMGLLTPEQVASLGRVIDASGFDTLKSLLMTTYHRDGIAVYDGFMLLQGERKGLFARPTKAIDLARLKSIPENSASFQMMSFELTPIYDFAMEALKEFDAEMHQQAVATLDSLGAQVGGEETPIRIREDFCENLGPTVTLLSPKKASMLSSIPPYLVALDVRNGDRVVEALRKVVEFAGQSFGQPIKIEAEARKGYTLYELNLGGDLAMFRPAFTVAGDQFYFSTEPGLIKQQMKRLEKSDAPDITSNPDFQKFASKLPQTGVVSVSYADTRYAFENMYDMAISTVPMLVQMSGVEVPIDFQIAPMRETISQHLFGSLDFMTEAENGYRMQGYGAVGSEIVGMSVGALGAAGIVMVANKMEEESEAASPGSPTAPARPAATPEDAAREHLKVLSSNVVLYRIENDKLPGSLADLMAPSPNYPNGLFEGEPLPVDPWGNAYFYSVEGKDFRVWSAGPNGIDEQGAGDDLLRTNSKS